MNLLLMNKEVWLFPGLLKTVEVWSFFNLLNQIRLRQVWPISPSCLTHKNQHLWSVHQLHCPQTHRCRCTLLTEDALLVYKVMELKLPRFTDTQQL